MITMVEWFFFNGRVFDVLIELLTKKPCFIIRPWWLVAISILCALNQRLGYPGLQSYLNVAMFVPWWFSNGYLCSAHD